MANTKEGAVQIAGLGTNSNSNRKIYDNWAERYEKDVRAWGYSMPEDCAKMLKKHCPEGKESTYQVLDAGAGDGLSGKAITKQGFVEVTGMDISPEQVAIAKKKNIYKHADVADLSKPLKYKTDQFDAITVVGVMTYLGPDDGCLDEFCRVVKPGGLVIMTHRTDKVDKWTLSFDELIKDGKWEKVEITEPLPYLPNNPEFGDKIKVIIHVFRVGKKETVNMKVTNKRSPGFYVKSAKSFFQGVEAKDGIKKDPINVLNITALGEAINMAVAAACACEKDGLAEITNIETTYPELTSGSVTRGCAAISIKLKRK